MEHLITFAIAFAGAHLAFALQRAMLVDEIRSSRLDAERNAPSFREHHRWLVVIAAEIDDVLSAHPELSNEEILEALRASARKGSKFTVEQVGVLRPADVGRARHWHMPGLASAPSERFFYQRVEMMLDDVATRLERYPEVARSVAQAPFSAARECGLVAPPDAGPALDSAGHVRHLAEHERRHVGIREGSARARRVHPTVRLLRSVGGVAGNAKASDDSAARLEPTCEDDE